MSDEMIIGDVDPEDAYAEDDPVEEKLFVLERIVDDIRTHADSRRKARREAVDELVTKIQNRVEALREKASKLGD